MSQDDQGGRLPRRFMGPDALTDLLAIAGSRFDADGAWVVLSTAHREGRTAGEAIPALFDGEPRISSPDHARLLYGNLLALWDFLEAGLTPPLGPDAGETAAPPPRPRAPPAPEPFGEATGRAGHRASRGQTRWRGHPRPLRRRAPHQLPGPCAPAVRQPARALGLPRGRAHPAAGPRRRRDRRAPTPSPRHAGPRTLRGGDPGRALDRAGLAASGGRREVPYPPPAHLRKPAGSLPRGA